MGCCGSRDSDSEDEIVTASSVRSAPNRGNSASSYHYPVPSRVNVAPSRVNVAPSRVNVAPSRANFAYTRVNVDPKYWHLDSDTSLPGPGRVATVPSSGVQPPGRSTAPTWGQFVSIRPYQPPADILQDQVDAIDHGAHHNEERHFFQIFFSVLDHVPGHQGILRRWEREAQRAECESGGRCDMSRVWLEAAGYVKTLQRVKMLVYNKKFSASDHAKLDEWAARVVKRRTREYNKAKTQGKADPKHLKVLEEWRRVRETIQELL